MSSTSNIFPLPPSVDHSDEWRSSNSLEMLERLNEIGIALSAERDTRSLLQRILDEAQSIISADGATVYLKKDKTLIFEILRTYSLRLNVGGVGEPAIDLPPIELCDGHGNCNDRTVVAYSANHKVSINICDAYDEEGFDFNGTKQFDKEMNYRSVSFLAVPLLDNNNDVIGVIQLINKLLPDGTVYQFTHQDQRLLESLASQAAVAVRNAQLMEQQKQLFEAFIELIASAIDEKSPYTGGHCRRVPELTMMFANKVSDTHLGRMADFRLNEQEYYALKIAAWLHDCGKITTPEYVVDKATKLETIFDRIQLLETRAEVLKRDLEIERLQRLLDHYRGEQRDEAVEHAAQQQLDAQLRLLDDDKQFLRDSNRGGEWMSDEAIERVQHIATMRSWGAPGGSREPFLSDNEVYNLSIRRGTLTQEERAIINHHIEASIRMLETLPFPEHLRMVPEYAGGHHERMDGKGYPRGLKRDQMSIPARMMAIADIFEALTAADRPYKSAKPLSEALSILGRMKQDGHIDPDLFDAFIQERVYLDYADRYLDEKQRDITEPEQIPGFPFD